MCHQVNHLYSCGHRSFKRFDNCPRFGQGCFGAGGSSNHKDEALARACHDCKLREDLLIRQQQKQRSSSNRSSQQQQQGSGGANSPGTPLGSSPSTSSSTGGSSGGGAGEVQDPWWDGDPWRKYRTG